MAFHSHGSSRFEAQRVFTDRTEPVALFETAFRSEQGRDDHRVLCWYGVGGQGKSSLHNEMRRRVRDEPGVALAGLDFEIARHKHQEEALLKLRGDFGKAGLAFPTFDLAFARYFASDRPLEDIRKVHPQLFRKGESDIIDDMIDWSEAAVDTALVGASLLAPGLNLVYKYGARLTGRLVDWWASRDVKEHLRGLDDMSLSQIADQLPRFLGFDVWRARAETGCPRIVLTIDTHEKLASGELRADAWLQSLVQQMPGALILIFGRDKLRWAEIDPEWENVLDQHLLGALSDEDADSFLAKVPIEEADIRARIVAASDGLPHYLDLAVSQYEALRNRGHEPTPDDFGTTPTQVRDRFLDHLPESERRELFIASYPESLSEQLFLDLADAFLGGAGNVSWARLSHRSFMTDEEGDCLSMHALMRDALQTQEKNDRQMLYERVHSFLLDQCSSLVLPPSNWKNVARYFDQATCHAEALGAAKLLAWLKAFAKAYPYKNGREFIPAFIKAETLFQNPSLDRAWILEWLADALYFSDPEKHKKYLEESLSLSRDFLGETSENYIRILGKLGVTNSSGGRDEAKHLFEKAHFLAESTYGPLHHLSLKTLNSLACFKVSTQKYEDAAADFQKVIDTEDKLSEKTGPTMEQVRRAATQLGYIRQSQGQLAEALAAHEKALGILLEFEGENEWGQVDALEELEKISRRMGRLDKAANYLRMSLERKKRNDLNLDDAINRFSDIIRLADLEVDLGNLPEAHRILENLKQSLVAAGKKESGSYIVSSEYSTLCRSKFDPKVDVATEMEKTQDFLLSEIRRTGRRPLFLRRVLKLRKRVGFTEEIAPLLEACVATLKDVPEVMATHVTALMLDLAKIRISERSTEEAISLLNNVYAQFDFAKVFDSGALLQLVDMWVGIGNLDKAAEVCEVALCVAEANDEVKEGPRAFLGEGSSALRPLEKLGDLRFQLKRPAEALSLYQRAIEITRKQYGNRSKDHGRYARKLGAAHFALASFEKSADQYKIAREDFRNKYGSNSVPYMTLTTDLAKVLLCQGEFEEAKQLLEEALEIHREAAPDAEPSLRILTNLWRAESGLGNLRRAEILIAKVLAKVRTRYGERHRYTAIALAHLSMAKFSLGAYEAAGALLSEVSAIDAATLPNDHPEVLLTQTMVASVLAAQGETDEARIQFKSVIERTGEISDRAPYWQGRIHLQWARGLEAAGLAVEAAEEARTALQLLSRDPRTSAEHKIMAQALMGETA